jgi:molybdopterin converting factor small subunit
MSDPSARTPTSETEVTVRYWASARAAAGVPEDRIPATGELTLDDVVRRVVDLHPGTRLPELVKICSVLVGDRPAGTRPPEQVVVRPGDTVEFLPPFAGG